MQRTNAKTTTIKTKTAKATKDKYKRQQKQRTHYRHDDTHLGALDQSVEAACALKLVGRRGVTH
jgi:hypothetical protein